MEIGPLRHRVIIQTRSTALGERGEASTTWTNVATRWARVETLSGSELELARRLYGEATHRVTLRYYAGVNVETRFKFGSRYLHVGHVDDPEQRHILLVLQCGEARN